MRRSLTLMRTILGSVADHDKPVDAEELACKWHSFEEIAYHMEIMAQGGLVRASLLRRPGGGYSKASAWGPTWEGHELLALLGCDEVYHEVTRAIDERLGGHAAMETIETYAKRVAEELLMG